MKRLSKMLDAGAPHPLRAHTWPSKSSTTAGIGPETDTRQGVESPPSIATKEAPEGIRDGSHGSVLETKHPHPGKYGKALAPSRSPMRRLQTAMGDNRRSQGCIRTRPNATNALAAPCGTTIATRSECPYSQPQIRTGMRRTFNACAGRNIAPPTTGHMPTKRHRCTAIRLDSAEIPAETSPDIQVASDLCVGWLFDHAGCALLF
jgi:hypothetical protein